MTYKIMLYLLIDSLIKILMKNLITFTLTLLIAGCLYVEGDIIEEPKDVVIGDSVTKFAPWERCATVDVTAPHK